MSDSVRPHRRQPTRLPHPWDSPGKNTGVGCHFLLQCMKVKNESEVAQSCLTLSDPMDSSPPGSSIHGIFQARVLEWDAIAFSDNSAIVQWKKKLIPNIVHSLSRNLIIELLEVDAWNNQVSSHKQLLWHWVKPRALVLMWVPQALELVVCLWAFVKARSFGTLTSCIPFPSYHLSDAGNPWCPCQRGVILSPLVSPVKCDSCVAFL